MDTSLQPTITLTTTKPPTLNTHNPIDAATIADELARRIGSKPFRMWFGTADLTVQDDCIRIQTGSRFEADWIARRFGRDLDATAADTLGATATVSITTRDTPAPARMSAPAVAPSTARPASPRRRFLDLEEFVVGASNRLAWAATTGIVEGTGPGVPLFIHGPCGVGKTHLLQGLCRQIGTRDGWSSLRYLTGEQFTNEYISALKDKRIERFRRSLRRLRLLAIDDVHFVAGKQRTQEELLHTIDAISMGGAQIVLASDAAPDQIRRFQRGLVSRCRGGNVVGVEPPDLDTCRSLARRIAMARSLSLETTAVELIAAESGDEVRAMSGLLTRVAAARMLTPCDGPVSCSEIRSALQYGSVKVPIRLPDLITATAEVLGLTVPTLIGSGRTQRVVLGRALVAWLARDCTGASFPEIAYSLKRRSHSSAIAGHRRIEQDLAKGVKVPLAQAQVPLADLAQRIRRRAQQ